MATAVKRKLSGSTDGKNITVLSTTVSGDTIHTSVAGTTPGTYDEIWLYACNNYTANVQLTIQYGGQSSNYDEINITIPYKQGFFLIVPGLILQNGDIVKAYAGTTAVVNINGFVNSITD